MTDLLAPGELLPLSSDWFRALAQTTATAIFVYSLDAILYVNGAAVELTGYGESELLRMSPDQLFVPEQRERTRSGRARRMAGDPTPTRTEVQFLRKDGERRWVLLTGASIGWQGERAGISTGTDITDRVRAETALRRQVRFEQTVAEVTRHFLQLPGGAMPDGVRYALDRLGPLL